jgi:cytochrome c-type biogenesis protein CcmH/NrfG
MNVLAFGAFLKIAAPKEAYILAPMNTRSRSMKTIAASLLLMLMLFSGAHAIGKQSDAGGRQAAQSTRKRGNEAQNPEELLKTAEELLDKGQVDQAQAILKRLADAYPQAPFVHYALGFSYYKQDKFKSASEELGKGLLLRPDKKAYLFKADLDLMRNAPQEALQTCKDAIKFAPGSGEVYVLMGRAQMALDKKSDAVDSFKRATQLSPNYADAFVVLGDILSGEGLGTVQEVIDAYTKAMEADPQHQAGRFQLGRFLVRQGKLGEARKLWEGRASDEDKVFPNFIEVLERAENLQRAEKAIAESPNDPKTLVQYGVAIMAGDDWVADGRQEKALPYFKQAIKLDPKNAEAHYALGRCYVELAHSAITKDPAKLKREARNEVTILKQLSRDLASKLEDYIKQPPGGIFGSPLDLDR